MSAITPKADIAERRRHVRFVPKADSCTAASRFGGFEIYKEFKLGRLKDR
jgi:hypothetical protein